MYWGIPVTANNETTYILANHPTPPVFDGAEDHNGTRNHDEIRLWAEYVLPSTAGLELMQGEVFWPGSYESLHRLTGHAILVRSDQLMVGLDLNIKNESSIQSYSEKGIEGVC